MLLLSATGTLRLILVLTIVWLLLRAYMRSREPSACVGYAPMRARRF